MNNQDKVIVELEKNQIMTLLYYTGKLTMGDIEHEFHASDLAKARKALTRYVEVDNNAKG